jgi:hypothetical protein
MSDLSFIDQLSPADVDAILDGNVDKLSDAGVDLISSLDDAQFAQLTGRQSAPAEEAAPADPQANAGAALAGMFGTSDETGRQIADVAEPVLASQFMQGVGRTAQSTKYGLQQLASSPEEALAIGKIEEKARKDFESVDEGLGMEDVGEAVGFIASLAIPGTAPIKAAVGGAKILNAIKVAAGTLGGQSLLAGLLEGTKAVTPEESRIVNAGTAAGFTALGGAGFNAGNALIKNSFQKGSMGKLLSALGVASMQGHNEARRVVTGGLARRWGQKLWGRVPKDEVGDNAERQGLTLQRKAVEARAAEAAKDGLAPGDPVWDSWFNLVRGPHGKTLKSGKPGRRRKASGLEGAAPSKTQGDLSNLDVLAERNRIVSTLMSSAQKEMPDGNIMFDVKAARRSWDILKENPNFKKIYMTKSKTGKETLGSKANAVEEFLDGLLTKGVPDGEGVSVRASTIFADGSKDVIEDAVSRADRLAAAKTQSPKTPAPTRSQINSRAAGVTVQQFQDQGLIEDAENNVVTGGWFGFMDYFDSLEEQARAAGGDE